MKTNTKIYTKEYVEEEFQSVEDLIGAKDGLYKSKTGRFLFNDFKNEKGMVEFIVENIDNITKDYFDDEVVSFEVDAPINKYQNFGPRGRRIDLLIQGKKKLYIIETKNIKNTTEMRYGIGQILDYGREFDTEKELVLISNLYDINTNKTIKHYNLPIRYIIMNKTKSLEVCEDQQ